MPINQHIPKENHELVLAIPRTELEAQGVKSGGVHTFDLTKLHPYNYGFLPRYFADNKSNDAIQLGEVMPQLVGYFQVVTTDRKYLVYQRKGKEEGLLGKWSIGVGGHVSQDDMFDIMQTGKHARQSTNPPTLWDILLLGMQRELEEEIGFDKNRTQFKPEDFTQCVAIVDHGDATSTVHVGLYKELQLYPNERVSLALDPKEFLNVRWMTQKEMIDAHRDEELGFETWSAKLIESWVY